MSNKESGYVYILTNPNFSCWLAMKVITVIEGSFRTKGFMYICN